MKWRDIGRFGLFLAVITASDVLFCWLSGDRPNAQGGIILAAMMTIIFAVRETREDTLP